MVTLKLTIDGNDYSDYLLDVILRKKVTYAVTTLNILLADTEFTDGTTIFSRLNTGQTVVLEYDTTKVFSGGVENFSIDERGIIQVTAKSTIDKLNDRYVNETFSSKTASEIVEYLLSTYYSSDFTYTTGTTIIATTTTYNRRYVGITPFEIIQEMAALEEYMAYVDENNVFYFVPFSMYDTGYNLSDDDLLTSEFPSLGEDIKNVVYVIGAGGTPDHDSIRVVVRDSVSIAKYGKRPMRIIDTSIDTTDKAFNVAYAELRARSDPSIDAAIKLDYDTYQVEAGNLITLTSDAYHLTNVQFLVTESTWDVLGGIVDCRILSSRNLRRKLITLLQKTYAMERTHTDYSATVVDYEYALEEIQVIATYEFWYQSIDTTTAIIEEGNIEEFNIDAGFETFTLKSDGYMVVTNTGLNALRDMIQGKSGTPPLNASNTGIALGSDNTPALVTQTALVSESIRGGMDAGYPSDGSAIGENVFESTFTDTEVISGTYEELGLFNNASTGGTMICRAAPGTPFSKIANENLKIRIILKLTQ